MILLRPLVTVLGLLLAWQVLVWITGVPAFILPGPGRVAAALASQPSLLLRHAAVTLQEIFWGILLGSLIGASSAMLLAASRTAQRWLMPLLVVSQALPVFALAPILVLWFGYGMPSKIAMAVLIIYFPVTAAFLDGLRRTDPGWLELARTMDARPWAILRHIRVPAALPALDLRPASGGRGGADRGRGRRVGRLQRRARLPDAARQCADAGRPDVRRVDHPGRHGTGHLADRRPRRPHPGTLAAG